MDIDGAVLSDCAPILFSIPYWKPAPNQKQLTLRTVKGIAMTAFLGRYLSEDIKELAEQYETTLIEILDTHASTNHY